ncbi:hypothetical protein BCR32DRAFT_290930 [Anaeromyces robustus]|uniref:Lipoprotein n=1 Tax=Anaeromyces robustus TaxID=1754192 RepID=A0A1Y1XI87_9FUNG|nr:hypothetical protein BCR32DRAFT_290930 [Anaeromyces robustus]|eukprot:ORX85074.1 hypothetical protein BCR32DRAFT_290930 [Anaeromyces robustus]
MNFKGILGILSLTALVTAGCEFTGSAYVKSGDCIRVFWGNNGRACGKYGIGTTSKWKYAENLKQGYPLLCNNNNSGYNIEWCIDDSYKKVAKWQEDKTNDGYKCVWIVSDKLKEFDKDVLYLFINDVFNDYLNNGVKINTEFCCGRLFEDDIVFCASNRSPMNNLLRLVGKWVKDNEMTFGINKYTTLAVRYDKSEFIYREDPTFYLSGISISKIDCYTYFLQIS